MKRYTTEASPNNDTKNKRREKNCQLNYTVRRSMELILLHQGPSIQENITLAIFLSYVQLIETSHGYSMTTFIFPF